MTNTYRYILANLIALFSGLAGINAQNFNELLEDLKPLAQSQKESMILDYINDAGGLPLVDDDTVIFLAHSPLHPPKIMSGFNGFLSPRYITDSTAGNMIHIAGTAWHYRKQLLAKDARIYYQIEAGGKVHNDPFNTSLGYRFSMVNSEFRMPDFEIHPELIENQFAAKGAVEKVTFNSEALGHNRTVHVYTPPDYQGNSRDYPTVYFHDGSFYLDWGKAPQIMDYLISQKLMQPVIAVFDDPVERGKEYRGDTAYINYINKELIPHVDSNYRSLATREARAVVGGSRGALSSLILSHSSAAFSKCGTFSPAVYPREIQEFISFLSGAENKPQQVVIIAAIYDKIWYDDAVALRTYFESTPTSFKYQDISQGHNIQSWVNHLDEILMAFFP